ncbi:MAG: transposase, partial [Nitrosomonas sp.]|nr:transposase [Nitrosomonas sp.]MDP1949855.1 transposase [Nitrosomonas sp.]
MAVPTQQQKHIATWQASGLSQVAYCRQHGLNSKTFSSWLQVYRSRQGSSAASTLIPVEIKSKVSPSVSLYLRWPQGHTLELPADVDADTKIQIQMLLEQSQKEIHSRQLKIQALTMELAYLRRVQFGKKSESLSTAHPDLFEETPQPDLAGVTA